MTAAHRGRTPPGSVVVEDQALDVHQKTRQGHVHAQRAGQRHFTMCKLQGHQKVCKRVKKRAPKTLSGKQGANSRRFSARP